MRIDKDTSSTMHRMKERLSLVSYERITHELNKMLLGDNVSDVLIEYSDVLAVIIPEIKPMVGFDQHNYHHDFDVWRHTVAVVAGSKKDLSLRLSALLHDIAKPRTYTVDENGTGHFFGHASLGAQMSEEILLRLKYPTKTVSEVTGIIKHHADVFVVEERPVKRLLSKFGMNGLCRLAELRKADSLGKKKAGVEDIKSISEADRLVSMAEEIVKAEKCFSLKQLALNGDDIMSFGIPAGREIGRLLQEALDAVIDGRCENTKESCIRYLGLK